jgi:hypothetical protein
VCWAWGVLLVAAETLRARSPAAELDVRPAVRVG